MVARPRGLLRNCGADMAAHCINDVDHLRGRAPGPARLRRREPDRPRAGRGARRGRGEGLPHRRRRADRGRDGRDARASTGRRARLRRRPASGSSTRGPDRRIPHRGGRRRARLPLRRGACQRFTLVRRVLEEEDYDGDDLLAPTRLYLDDFAQAARASARFAHVTGGGIAGNLDRVLPDGRRAEIDWDAWERPSSSTGSHAMSTRRSSGASSTSASAGAPSCREAEPRRARDRTDRVIGVLVAARARTFRH